MKHRFRGSGPVPELDYDVGDFVYSDQRGYLYFNEAGNWLPMVATPTLATVGPRASVERPDVMASMAGRSSVLSVPVAVTEQTGSVATRASVANAGTVATKVAAGSSLRRKVAARRSRMPSST